MRAFVALLAVVVVGCASEGAPEAATDPATSMPSQTLTSGESLTSGPPSSDAGPTELDQDVLGTNGYLGLELGTSMADARAAGLLLDDGRRAPVELSLISTRNGPCQGFLFGMYGDAMGYRAHGYFSDEGGLAVVYGQGNMKTREGVGYGTSLAELWRAFPSLSTSSSGFYRAATSPSTEYLFRLDQADRVRYFGVAVTGDACAAMGVPSEPTDPLQPK